MKLSCLASILVGCAVPAVDDEIGSHQIPVINGLPTTGDISDDYDATVALHGLASGGYSNRPFCSGTLIASNVVLTAAHCLDVAQGYKPKFQARSASSLVVYVGADPSVDFATSHYAVQQVVINPSYDRVRLTNDVGLLRLAASVPDVTPVPNLPAGLGLTETDAVQGTPIDFAGFGYSDLAKITFGVRLHQVTPMGALGCDRDLYPNCPSGAPIATQFSYEQDASGPCNGDSGGSGFIDRGGVRFVAGITSYGDAACDQYGVSTRVDAFQTLIDDQVAAWDCSDNGSCNASCASDPDCPNCSADGECNEVCADDPDCAPPPPPAPACDADGVCEVGESCDGRNGTAACGDCPGVSGGAPKSRYCYVEGVCEGRGC